MKNSLTLASILLLALALAACGPPPKPQELAELERMRNDSYTAQISQTAPDVLEKADRFYKMSREAWQDSEMERAKEYAWLGQLRYRTAEAQTRTKEENERNTELTQQLQKVTQEIELARVKKDGLEKTLAALEGKVAAEADKSAMEEQKVVQEAILGAEAARERAKGVKAGEFAAGTYNKGENILKLAQEHLAAGRLKEASKAAGEAKVTFEAAAAEAKPEFDKTEASRMTAERQQKLLDAANKIPNAEAIQDSRGVVVVFPTMFERRKTSILGGLEPSLEKAAQVAKDFPETTVMVEGYTQSRGSESKNLTISQTRADVVRDYMIGQGIDAKRFVTTGYGEQKPRYDNKDRSERAKNDRVELVYVFTGK